MGKATLKIFHAEFYPQNNLEEAGNSTVGHALSTPLTLTLRPGNKENKANQIPPFHIQTGEELEFVTESNLLCDDVQVINPRQTQG